jgi:hypothetical protein
MGPPPTLKYGLFFTCQFVITVKGFLLNKSFGWSYDIAEKLLKCQQTPIAQSLEYINFIQSSESADVKYT